MIGARTDGVGGGLEPGADLLEPADSIIPANLGQCCELDTLSAQRTK